MKGHLAMRFSSHLLALSLLTLSAVTGCSRQTGMSSPAGMSPTGSLGPEAIPAGTPITIRLQAVVSSDRSHSGDSFAAVLEEPIIVHDLTIADRGAPVTGKVLTAKASVRWQDPGYLRLTLAAISIHGKLLPLQTSSIFAKGASSDMRTSKEDVGFPPDRRLTFRLTQSLPVEN
jgi:hypothetical protein